MSFGDICLAHGMPAGWPDAPRRLQRGHELYREALMKVSDLPDPEKFAATFEKIRIHTAK